MDAGAAAGAVGDKAADGARKLYLKVLRQIVQLSFQVGGRIGLVIIALFTAILGLFILHQLTIWISRAPPFALLSARLHPHF
jgi:hypothetical protein